MSRQYCPFSALTPTQEEERSLACLPASGYIPTLLPHSKVRRKEDTGRGGESFLATYHTERLCIIDAVDPQ